MVLGDQLRSYCSRLVGKIWLSDSVKHAIFKKRDKNTFLVLNCESFLKIIFKHRNYIRTNVWLLGQCLG